MTVGGPFLLVRRVIVFGLLLLTVLVGVAWVTGSRPRVDYYQALGPKQVRLQALGSPKLVVIGGSNAAFGMDSRALEEALCLPAVNMTLHASLGLRYMANEVSGALGAGDMVILTMEPGMFADHSSDQELASAIDGSPGTWRFVPWPDRPKALATALVMRLKGAWRAISEWRGVPVGDPVYSARAFDMRGDLQLSAAALAADTGALPTVQYDTALAGHIPGELARLRDMAEAAGARILFAWPATAASATQADLDHRTKGLMHAAGIPVLGEQERYVLPDTAFLDTPYHLRPWGKGKRTALLIADLCDLQGCCPQR